MSRTSRPVLAGVDEVVDDQQPLAVPPPRAAVRPKCLEHLQVALLVWSSSRETVSIMERQVRGPTIAPAPTRRGLMAMTA